MSCCNRKFYEHVKCQEQKVNEKGQDTMPLSLKATMVTVIIIAIVLKGIL